MLEITSHRQGALLNHHHGKETGSGLTVRIEGWSDSMYPVTVNGVPAIRNGRGFSAEITLTEKLNTVTAASHTNYGDFSQSVVLLWDKKSFKRFNFFIDDNVFFMTDIARERPRRAFDHFYLAGLKKIHEKYGTRFTLNCFYRNCHNPFEIKDFPDIYKSEFIDNSDWLRLSFHAFGEFPDRPYQDASYEQLARDYDLVKHFILADTAEGGVVGMHADVGNVVQLAEDAQLGELGDAGEEDEAQVGVAGLQGAVEVPHHVAEYGKVCFFMHHVQERGIVFID